MSWNVNKIERARFQDISYFGIFLCMSYTIINDYLCMPVACDNWLCFCFMRDLVKMCGTFINRI